MILMLASERFVILNFMSDLTQANSISVMTRGCGLLFAGFKGAFAILWKWAKGGNAQKGLLRQDIEKAFI